MVKIEKIKISELKKEPHYIEACFNIYLKIILIDEGFCNLRKTSILYLNIFNTT